jgi:hypothetical protein
MEISVLQEYLGMAVYFVYYHHPRLHLEKVFADDYCEHLMTVGKKEYWEKMHECLGFAMTQEDYCLSIIQPELKERYSDDDIKLFFRKFHAYLGGCLAK